MSIRTLILFLGWTLPACLALAAEPPPIFLGGGDFKDPAAVKWEVTGGAKGELSREHAGPGGGSLKVDVSTGGSPGIGIDFAKPMDFSPYASIRFSVFNATRQTLRMTFRVNDRGSIKNVGTLYMLDPPRKIDPGPHEMELTVGSMRQGTMLSRGLDVDRITAIRLFFDPIKKPAFVYFSDIRLVPASPSGPEIHKIADFSDRGALKWTAQEATAQVVPGPWGGKPSLRVELAAGGKYPGVTFSGFPSDWLSYDLLCLDVNCPDDAPPKDITLKIVDGDEHQQTLCTTLVKGVNPITVPVEVLSWVGLGKITRLSLFATGGDEKKVLVVGGVSLRRVRHRDLPSLHGPGEGQPALKADFTSANFPRNTCYYAFVWTPLAEGSYRFLRCNSIGRNVLVYGISAAALEGMAKDKPVRAWTYVSDHGVWHFRDITLSWDGKPASFGFEVQGRQAF